MIKLTRTDLTTILQAMHTAEDKTGSYLGKHAKMAMLENMMGDVTFLVALETELSAALEIAPENKK